MRIDVLPRPLERVRLPRVEPFGEHAPIPARTPRHGFHRLIHRFEESDQIPCEAKPSVAPGIAETYFRIEREVRESPQVANPERETGRDIGGRYGSAISQHQPHG